MEENGAVFDDVSSGNCLELYKQFEAQWKFGERLDPLKIKTWSPNNVFVDSLTHPLNELKDTLFFTSLCMSL